MDNSTCACAGQDLGVVLAYHIEEAMDTVDVAVMELQDFNVSRALAEAARRGVEVRVVLDDRYGDDRDQLALGDLSAASIPWITDPDPQRLMHSKFLVVDSRWTVVSSGNFSTFDARSNANNLLVFDSLELAEAFGRRFDSLFQQKQFYVPDKPSAGSISVDGEDVEVLHGPSDTFLQQWTGAIAAARSSIHFSIYAFTLQEVRDAILLRCGEVEILGVYDSNQSDDPNSVDLESWCPQATVRAARVPGDDFGFRKLHHKVLIIDAGRPDGFVISGSANWSYSAIARNTEELIVVRHPDLVREYEGEFQARFQEAHSP
jgi:phosphatidylserine/phosphatidylglycerophosphate/cardiolipin synthase-like enzyme